MDKVGKSTLQKFMPLRQLGRSHLSDLVRQAELVNASAGKVIFETGAKSGAVFFLLSGEVVLWDGRKTRKQIKADDKEAEWELTARYPEGFSCVAHTTCRLVKLDKGLLDVALTLDQSTGMEVTDIGLQQAAGVSMGEKHGDWLAGLLQAKAFRRLPPTTLQVLFGNMNELHVKAGKYIIRQGERGDYYYLIKRGRCEVLRGNRDGDRTQFKIAELKTGDSFGEEALISNYKRNASVRVVTNSVLMSLHKKFFGEMLKPPLLRWIPKARARKMVHRGDAFWVDVRQEKEHKDNAVDGSINIPLFMLRLRADLLDRKSKYIVYCDSGRLSAVGTFLLNERGVQAYCLHGGLKSLQRMS